MPFFRFLFAQRRHCVSMHKRKMMNHPILLLFVLIDVFMVQAGAQSADNYLDPQYDTDIFGVSESLSTMPPIANESLATQYTPSSTILQHLSTGRMSGNTSSSLPHNQSVSSPSTPQTSKKTKTTTTTELAPFLLASRLVDQFNNARNIQILARVKECDEHLKLYEICERYSIDNHTYSLIRQAPVEYQSLQHLYNALIDRTVVKNLTQFCAPGRWCLKNLTQQDVRYTDMVIRQRGQSFCSLEECQQRLVHMTACPSLSTKNVTIPTLRLLPMLCALYREQQNWTSVECVNAMANLLHLLYAFWPQIETCHYLISTGIGGCTAECREFGNLFNQIENQCPGSGSFLTRVPALAWYRSINMEQICRPKPMSTNPPLISSVKNFLTFDSLSYQIRQKPVYTTLFILIFICIVLSFSLCLYYMSQSDNDSNTRRFDDDYEYTRLHNSTFELGTDTETPNGNSTTTNGMITDPNGHLRPAEYQRLLHGEV